MLDRYTILDTDDFDLTRDIHAVQGMTLEPQRKRRRKSRIHSKICLFDHPDFQFYYFSHSDTLTLSTEVENNHYWIALPVEEGPANQIRLINRESRIASPGGVYPVTLPGKEKTLGFCLKTHTLQNIAESYLGDEVGAPLIFQPRFNMQQTAHRVIGQLIAMLVEEDSHEASTLSNQMRVSGFLNAVTSTMLCYCPHSQSDQMRGASAAPAPRDVKRVMDYIRSEADQLITLEMLVQVAEVPGRTLNQHFRGFTGLSPMAYLRRTRLRNARRRLMSGRAGSITAVALKCGIPHLGRFSQAYKGEFGELPSQTMHQVH